MDNIEEDLTQPVLTEEMDCQLMREFIEENELMVKYMMFCDIKEEIAKNVKEINAGLESQGEDIILISED